MNRPTVLQFNLSPTLGGAEVYTAFFSRALVARGWTTRIAVRARSRFWNDLDCGRALRVPFGAAKEALPQADEIVVVHSPHRAILQTLIGQYVIGIAHQALYDATRPEYYDRADALLAVSNHVIATLKRERLNAVYPLPLYGVADLVRSAKTGMLTRGPLFDADRHKARDLLQSALENFRRKLSIPCSYRLRRGVTLGIVSRIAPLKQFVVLFRFITPILLRHPSVNLEIFGAAVGYKALVELRRVLAPLGTRVRFWGHQCDVLAAYRAVDYLLTGLPEREALGLNVIESCAAGTPVLAVAAPPFSETMQDGVTGFLYVDPRHDGGTDFERVLTGIERGTLRPDLNAASAHLETFSFERFADRVDAALTAIALNAS